MDPIIIVKSIAERLSDINYVNEVLLEKDNYLELGSMNFYPHIPLSLSHGLPGLCLLYSELHKLYPTEGWHDLCNYYIKIMVDLISEKGLYKHSLFSGTSGIALSVMASSDNGKHYNSLLKTLNDYLNEQLVEDLRRIVNKKTIDMFDYDVIEGVAGTANYLLLNGEKELDFLEEILQYFINLSMPVPYLNTKVPGWFIKKDNLFNDEEKKYYPNGILNLGMSHGILGPLTILCKAYNKKIIVHDQIDAIERIVKDIMKLQIKGTNEWNGMVGIDEYINGTYNSNALRDAWCYGTPGIAYSLLVASSTLNNKELFEVSCNSMKDAVKGEKGLFSPTFCHGYSGLAYMSYKFYSKTKEKLFLTESERLLEKILGYYDENSPFGFCNIENSNSKVKKQNSIALLDGVCGILLPILEITLKTNNVDWDAAFLLND